jgi:Na+-transporting NADH:ubiquinone oxidoreductase subunit NqrA
LYRLYNHQICASKRKIFWDTKWKASFLLVARAGGAVLEISRGNSSATTYPSFSQRQRQLRSAFPDLVQLLSRNKHQSLSNNLLEQRTWSKFRRAPLHSISIRMKSRSWSIEPLDTRPLLSLVVDTKDDTRSPSSGIFQNTPSHMFPRVLEH